MEKEVKGTEVPQPGPEAQTGPEDRTDLDARVREDIAQLAALFPRLKPEEVPREVWEEVGKGRSLALAYTLFRLRETERELKALKGRRLAAGSVSSAGSSPEEGWNAALAAYWDAYDV